MRRRSKCRIVYSFRKSIYFAQKKAHTSIHAHLRMLCNIMFLFWWLHFLRILYHCTYDHQKYTYSNFCVHCPVSSVQCCDQLIKKAHFIIGKINWYKDYWITYQKSRNAWSYIKRLDCVGFLDFYLGNFFLMNKIGHKNWINIDTLRRVYCEAFPKST